MLVLIAALIPSLLAFPPPVLDASKGVNADKFKEKLDAATLVCDMIF
jgi:hypothetical protein